MKKFLKVNSQLLIFLAAGLVFFATLLHRDSSAEKVQFTVSSNNLTAPAPIESVIPPEFQGKLSLFILAGQSNMSGRGAVLPASAGENPAPAHPRIFVFGNDYQWHLAAEPIDDAKGQVDKTSEDVDAGVSPGVAFATNLLEHNPNLIIGLIPCAKGGSSIAQWQRNLSEKTLYGSCLKRARAASTKGQIYGMLFFQGEADAIKPKLSSKNSLFPNQWASKFSAFIRDFRQDLTQPNLPVVFAQIGTNKAPKFFANWKLVQQQQRAVKLPSVAMITTNDLSLNDSVHFTAESYKVIGQRFAGAFLQLTQKR